ncbi:hypothetical protein EYF80_048384 [Liparis tanakae]|uniref:Uncharacterized protein n=1 Tax=Liparis tanakae TaxID=230148 RepID=A0A4Z2FKN3_9TELE|nr:hypothetical protein EYF80_048384 [Liparis tanakae]
MHLDVTYEAGLDCLNGTSAGLFPHIQTPEPLRTKKRKETRRSASQTVGVKVGEGEGEGGGLFPHTAVFAIEAASFLQPG